MSGKVGCCENEGVWVVEGELVFVRTKRFGMCDAATLHGSVGGCSP